MAPSFTLRLAGPQDAESMFSVHRASVHQLCAPSYSARHMAQWFSDRTPDIYAPALAARQIWVAESNGSVVGFVGAQPGEVTLLFVSPQATGQGIGSALFGHGVAQAEGPSRGPVAVVATLNSTSFYAARGFVAVEQQWFERGADRLRYPVVRMIRDAHAPGRPPHDRRGLCVTDSAAG